MAYTTINKSTDYFNTKLYTGNGSSQSFTGVGFQPDFTWIKRRGSAEGHSLFDAVRGVQKRLVTNDDGVEATISTSLTAFGSDGFTLGGNDTVNGSDNYASWNWLANNTSGSSNTDGDITSTVSVNQTSGFSIVKYTGNGSNDQTIGHGLGARPVCWIVKRTDTAADWYMMHQGIISNWYDDYFLVLNSTAAKSGSKNVGTGNPTSSVFYVGSDAISNASGGTYIAYVFAEKTGYSKFNSYVGNGSTDGTFVYTGFSPSFILWKSSSNAEGWWIVDNKRTTYNPTNNLLRPDLADAELVGNANLKLDFLSNGFKLRQTDGALNGSGLSYIYMAFASAPLVGTNNIPATGR